jgi:hypothetical protein
VARAPQMPPRPFSTARMPSGLLALVRVVVMDCQVLALGSWITYPRRMSCPGVTYAADP